MVGFTIEGGATNTSRELWPDYMPENSHWYRLYFFGQEHRNFFGEAPQLGVVIASVKPETIEKDGKTNYRYRVIIRSKDGNHKTCLTTNKRTYETWMAHCQSVLEQIEPRLKDVELIPF
eukprot:TRINITY_DN8898_c0_g1_i2.p1 TRINITY_DN8898_c0_g1~~TRINITY_DN8898_c0_g1_i2.p1  ORF type:complete len:119 (-),score=16.72 TRINITY_DN8898_c0_g1_i2:127-483(-)